VDRRRVVLQHKNALVLLLMAGSLLGAIVQGSFAFTKEKPASFIPEVTIYLHDGKDVTGTLKHLDSNEYSIQTKKGEVKIGRLRYQGMIVNIPEEKAIAQSITTDPMLYIAAARYGYSVRPLIREKVKEPTANCILKSYPVAHFQILRNGFVKNPQIILSSGCSGFDQSLLTAIQQMTPPAFNKDYTLDMFPMNFVYDPKTKPTTAATEKKAQ
jgi:hypothetical protein